MNDTVISIKNANVYLDSKQILQDINWQVERGENWFILGANGAGKTTLIRMLLGYVWPRFGAEINILSNRYGQTNLCELRKKFSWVSPFLQHWTDAKWHVIDIVISGLDGTIGLYRDVSEQEKKLALEMLDHLNCSDLADKPFHHISSGEQIKVLVARALITKPELMILDEACVHLDLKSREYLLEAIDNFAAQDHSPTILFITQRIEDITPVFNKGMLLSKGCIIAKGERDSIITEENLSRTFDINIKVQKAENGRMWAFIA